jgi:hypothetical protein
MIIMNRLTISLITLTFIIFEAKAQFPGSANEGVSKLLRGSVDFHIHSAPDAFERAINDIELAEHESSHGVKAIVLKNHFASTSGRAELVNSINKSVSVYGGVALNFAVGGINPKAVEAMSNISPRYGKVVWFPTLDAAFHKKEFNIEGDGISILNRGELTKETIQVLEIIADKHLVLATGHLSPEEVLALVKRANEMGIRNIIITHPLADSPGLSFDQMEELSKLGAKIELTFLSYLAGADSRLPFLRSSRHVTIKDMADAIKRLGAHHFILTSDLGQSGNALPCDGIKVFIELLLSEGISSEDIAIMIRENPSKLLGINK